MSRQRLDLFVTLQLGCQLQEEAQLADLHGLFHDVDAVEVVQDDGLEDEVALAGVLLHLPQDVFEVTQIVRATAIEAFFVVQEAAHPLQAGGVERFQNVEGGEEERAGTAGGIQDGDSGVAAFPVAVEGVPEGAQQLRPFALGDDVEGRIARYRGSA